MRSRPQATKTDLREQLEGDNNYQDEPTVDRFVYCFEKTATQW